MTSDWFTIRKPTILKILAISSLDYRACLGPQTKTLFSLGCTKFVEFHLFHYEIQQLSLH